jgi:hypothetical protein
MLREVLDEKFESGESFSEHSVKPRSELVAQRFETSPGTGGITRRMRTSCMKSDFATCALQYQTPVPGEELAKRDDYCESLADGRCAIKRADVLRFWKLGA